MAIIISNGRFDKEHGIRLVDASRFYFHIQSGFLSEAYNLLIGDMIKGEIIQVKKPLAIPELEGEQITFILKTGAIFDSLYISMDDWKKYFRDWGLVKADIVVDLKLTEAIRKATGERVTLYPKRDVKL